MANLLEQRPTSYGVQGQDVQLLAANANLTTPDATGWACDWGVEWYEYGPKRPTGAVDFTVAATYDSLSKAFSGVIPAATSVLMPVGNYRVSLWRTDAGTKTCLGSGVIRVVERYGNQPNPFPPAVVPVVYPSPADADIGKVLKVGGVPGAVTLYYATETGGGGGLPYVAGETPAGLVNGSNATYTTAYQFVPGSVSLSVNGLTQRPVTDFATSGTNTILLTSSPSAGDFVRTSYTRAS